MRIASPCPGYNRGARPSPGTVAELLAALDMEDDGTEGSIDLQRLKRREPRERTRCLSPDEVRELVFR